MGTLYEGQAKKTGLSGTAIVGIIVVIIVGASLAMLAWYSTRPHIIPIKMILDDPRTFHSKAVTCEGTVGNTMSLLGVRMYELTDDSGTIKVITRKGLPKTGDRLLVKAIVEEKFRLGGMSLIVLQEPQEAIR